MKEILENNWEYKTLEKVEKKNWGNADEGPSTLIRICLELRKIRLKDFSVEDLRLLIEQ